MKKQWYVLHTLTGVELEVQRYLHKQGLDAVVLQEERMIRRGGQWHKETRILFPGYVFIFICYTPQMFHLLKATPGAIRLLPKDKPMPLPPEDCSWLLWCAGEDILPVSMVDFSGSVPVIVDGPLEVFRDYIIKYDRHRRRAMLRIPVLGDYRDIALSFLPV